MNHFKRVKFYGAFALALALTLAWQQTAGARADDTWVAPLTAPINLVRPYQQPNSDYSAGHRGVDYEVSPGQTIFSPTQASVYFNQNLVDRPVLTLKTATGDLIEFEPACGSFPVGTSVNPGDAVGNVCPASANYKAHCPNLLCLHFSLRTTRGYLSPIVRYGALAPSVLLPYL
jgi:hypothetical protein